MEPPKNKAGILTTQPWISVCMVSNDLVRGGHGLYQSKIQTFSMNTEM